MELNASFTILQQQFVYDPGTLSTNTNSDMSNMRLMSTEFGGIEHEMMDVEQNEMDCFIDNDSDLNTLEGAANQSRLEHDKLSQEEMNAFPDVLENTSSIPIYLHIRNSILKYWLTNPRVSFLKFFTFLY